MDIPLSQIAREYLLEFTVNSIKQKHSFTAACIVTMIKVYVIDLEPFSH